nr:MAG TPA: hypothetical protein [Caudoviricetes sp.]
MTASFFLCHNSLLNFYTKKQPIVIQGCICYN